jgi:antitoxin FitA
MASITIRKFGDKLKRHRGMRAARHGRSMEDEARDILRVALAEESATPHDLGHTASLRVIRRCRGADRAA